MSYVKTIRRIIKIDEALGRIPWDDKYDEVYERLCDKRDLLVASIKEYLKCPDRTVRELRVRSYQRKKQVKLACQLLKVDYYTVIR